MPSSISLLGTKLKLYNKEEIFDCIKSGLPMHICTVNPEFLLLAKKRPDFRKKLESSYCIIDGSGIYFAEIFNSWLGLCKQIIPTYHGSDLVADLLEKYQDGSKSFFLLGGAKGQAEVMQDKLVNKYPNIQIVGINEGGQIDVNNPKLAPEVVLHIIQAKPDFLFLGFGAPKQELLMSQINVPVQVGVGGTFGFYSDKKRAPKWMRKLHLEWIFRTLTEPGHWKRTFKILVIFPIQVIFSSIQRRLLGKV